MNNENTTVAQASPRRALRITQGVLLAGIMAGVAAASLHLGAKHVEQTRVYDTVVQKTISDACSPAGPYGKDYRTTGLDTTTASSLLIRNPERAMEICATINGSLSAAHYQGKKLDNTSLHVLAGLMDVDEAVAQQLIAHQDAKNKAKTQLAHQDGGMLVVPATTVAPEFVAPSSLEPNL